MGGKDSQRRYHYRLVIMAPHYSAITPHPSPLPSPALTLPNSKLTYKPSRSEAMPLLSLLEKFQEPEQEFWETIRYGKKPVF